MVSRFTEDLKLVLSLVNDDTTDKWARHGVAEVGGRPCCRSEGEGKGTLAAAAAKGHFGAIEQVPCEGKLNYMMKAFGKAFLRKVIPNSAPEEGNNKRRRARGRGKYRTIGEVHALAPGLQRRREGSQLLGVRRPCGIHEDMRPLVPQAPRWCGPISTASQARRLVGSSRQPDRQALGFDGGIAAGWLRRPRRSSVRPPASSRSTDVRPGFSRVRPRPGSPHAFVHVPQVLFEVRIPALDFVAALGRRLAPARQAAGGRRVVGGPGVLPRRIQPGTPEVGTARSLRCVRVALRLAFSQRWAAFASSLTSPRRRMGSVVACPGPSPAPGLAPTHPTRHACGKPGSPVRRLAACLWRGSAQ